MEDVTSSHVAVTAQKDRIKFGYETKLRNLQAQLEASAAHHQTKLVDLQQRLSVALPMAAAQTREIRAVLERASQLELSAAQVAPVDELQASVLATLKSQLAEDGAGCSLRLRPDSLGDAGSSSEAQRIFDVLSKALGLKQTPLNKKKSRAVFDILVNTLALSQAIIAVGSQTLTRMGTKTLSKLMPPQNQAETRSQELFRVLFNCMLLSQAAVHQSLDQHGALGQDKPVRSRGGKGGVFVKA